MSQHLDESEDMNLEQDAVPAAADDGQPRRAGMVAWVASGAVHATMVMLMGTIYFLAQEPEIDVPPTRTQVLPAPPEQKPEKPKQERDILETKIELDIAVLAETPSPISPVVPAEEPNEREELNSSDTPKGREEAVSDSELGGQGAFIAIGPGGGGAGPMGLRTGDGKRRAVIAGGGTPATESAVEAALRWFKRHQSPNGAWNAERYFQNCTEDMKCEPGSLDGRGADEVDTALTGYALLAYLGAGYDHKIAGKYRTTVKKGIDQLLSIQKPDGMLGNRNYEHPIAAMALAEAYAMSSDKDLREPAQRAIDQILARQNADEGAGYGLGWDYGKPTKRNDASVTGWNVMALKSAYAAGLNVGNGMDGSKAWLEASWKANNDGKEGRPDWQKLDIYKDQSLFSYCWPSGAKEYQKDGFGHQNMAPVALVCSIFLGHRTGDPMLESLANFVMAKQVPKSYPTNTYYMYYNTMGIFQVGGERWKTWNAAVSTMLVDAQHRGDGCLDGSWDWQGTGFHGHQIGRVLSTAYNTLCLEVYYRWAQVNKVKPQHR